MLVCRGTGLQFVLFRIDTWVLLVLDGYALAAFLLDEEVLGVPGLCAVLEEEDGAVIVNHVALRLDVVVPEACLPELGDGVALLPGWITGHRNEGHQRAPLFGHLEQVLGALAVQIAQVQLGLGAQVLGQLIILEGLFIFLRED